MLCQKLPGGQKAIAVTKKYFLHINSHPLRHKMLGPKPVPLLIIVSPHSHEIKLIRPKMSPVFTDELRWSMLATHRFVVRSKRKQWPQVFLPPLLQHHRLWFTTAPSWLEMQRESSAEKTQALAPASSRSSEFTFCFFGRRQSTARQLLPCFLTASTSPKKMVMLHPS